MGVPITAIYAASFGILLVVLAFNVVRLRNTEGIVLGHGNYEPLKRAIRIHANATEYVPIALLLMLTFELNTHQEWLLNLFGSLLLVARFLHIWGLKNDSDLSLGRFVGTLMTWLVILGLAAVNLIYLPK